MSSACHENDESIIFDDCSTVKTVYEKCTEPKTLWTGNRSSNLTNDIDSVFFRSIDGHTRHIDHTFEHDMEDSPLLENLSDCYQEPIDLEFHCHDALTKSIEDTKAWKKLTLAAIFCFSFMIAELIGGYIAGSLAIMADAAHLFSDFVGFLISLAAIWIATKSATNYMTFGFYRAEVLGALLSILTIWLLAGVFSAFAITRLYKQDYEIDANAMIVVALIGLTVNIVMGFILHGVCHGHSHGLSSISVSTENINVRAAAAHVLGDLLQSVGVLTAAVIIKVYPGAKIADPICTLLFSIIVIWTTVRVGKDSLWFLLEGSPINSQTIITDLRKISGVRHVHNLHIWSLAPGKHAATVHLAVDKFCNKDVLVERATKVIQNKIRTLSCTVQVEAFNSEVVDSCKQCQSHSQEC